MRRAKICASSPLAAESQRRAREPRAQTRPGRLGERGLAARTSSAGREVDREPRGDQRSTREHVAEQRVRLQAIAIVVDLGWISGDAIEVGRELIVLIARE